MNRLSISLFAFLIFSSFYCKAQYISTSETVPFTCPSVCAGGTLVLKIFQIQNLSAGAQVQAVLSNSTGGFGSGTATISCNRYSTVSATGPWINGPYTFSANASNIFFEFTIPISTTPATGYTVHFKSGSTVGANMQMPCTGFTVTPSYTPLAALAQNTYGTGQWIAHAYTWTPTTGATLNTPALVAAQNFFDPTNYKGHFLKNSLNFDLNYTPNGGKMPGPLTVLHDGTSFQCGDGYSTNYSLRFYRTENFAAGLYQLEIQGDDGIRLSIDGGLTWLLNSFLEQPYAGSLKTTATLNPGGICLSGPTQLVVEYFQRPADAHIRFACNLLSANTITQPSNLSICAGQIANFSTNSVASATYQWQVSTNNGATFTPLTNNANYSGVTTNNLQVSGTTVAMNSNLYNCVITGICTNPITTSNAMLTITSIAPTISAQPVSATTCDLGSASFSVSANGSATYQWQRDSSGIFVNLHNNPPFSNTTAATLNISPAGSSLNNTNYQCLVSGCSASTTSSVVNLTVTPNASVTVQPVNQSTCAGGNATFTITATDAISYQWQENTGTGFVNLTNGGIYSNVTTASLTLTNVTAGMSGNLYQCVVNGCSGTVASVAVPLTVNSTASITTQPIDNTLCLGANGTFTIGVPLGSTCQWQLNTGSGFTNIVNNSTYSGSTTSTLVISAMTASMNNYQFQCIVGGCGSSTLSSNVVNLFLGSSASILNQPSAANLCGTGSTNFTIAASNAQSYQWQINTGSGFNNLSNGGIYSGVNTSQLQISGAGAAQNGNQYQCIISSCSGTNVISNAVSLQIQPTATITTQPQNQSSCEGQSASFSCAVQNATAVSWEGGFGTNFLPLNNGGNISITGNTLTLQNLTASQNNYQIRCVYTDCAGTNFSNVASLSVTPLVTLNSSSTSQTVCEGDNTNFSISAASAISYQWQVDQGSGFVNLSNSAPYSNVTTANLLITNPTLAINNYKFRCIASGCAASTVTSSPSNLTVLEVSNLISQTPNAVICEGENASLTITTSASASYQWQINSGSGFVNLNDGGIYSGTQTQVLSITNAGLSENGNSYQCIYTSCGPSKTSAPIPFTVQTLPLVLEHPTSVKVCETEKAVLEILAQGTNPIYHWQISSDGGLNFTDLQNNSDYSGVSTNVLIIYSVNLTDKGKLYRCAIDGCGITVYSNPAQIDVTENAQNLYVPNAFSPDGDGLNDRFVINPYGLKEIKGVIFDRWGELVFEWNDLTSSWDGSYKGMIVPVGVYVYQIEVTGTCAERRFEKKGTVSVIK